MKKKKLTLNGLINGLNNYAEAITKYYFDVEVHDWGKVVFRRPFPDLHYKQYFKVLDEIKNEMGADDVLLKELKLNYPYEKWVERVDECFYRLRPKYVEEYGEKKSIFDK